MKNNDKIFRKNNPYHERTKNLLLLGFETYLQYLRSPIWKRTSKQVLHGQRCISCRRHRATVGHHASYDLATMRGERTDTILAVCRGCHKRAERFARQTLAPAEDRLNIVTAELLAGVFRRQRRRRLPQYVPPQVVSVIDRTPRLVKRLTKESPL